MGAAPPGSVLRAAKGAARRAARPGAGSHRRAESGRRLPPTAPVVTSLLGLAGLVGLSFALRAAELSSALWIDEGISVGIASHRLTEIPGLLAQDGSPPLYYVLLHGWMALFGASETATHALSMALALAAIPAALWAGSSLFGRRVGWIFAALVAISPYLAYFANETRMYALVTLLSLVATASFLHVFTYGRRRHLWLFAAALTLVLYTHSWGLWLVVGLATALVPCALAAADRRRVLLDAALGFGAAGLAYLPWLPTLLFQRAHTGAPWSLRPPLREAVSVVAVVLGDNRERVLVALVLVAGPALWALLRDGGQHRAVGGGGGRDGADSPHLDPAGRLRPALVALGLVAAVPVAVGWLAAQVTPSWSPRYLAVCAPAVLLLAAIGLAHARGVGLLALALILTLWVQPLGRIAGLRPEDRLEAKPIITPLIQAVAPGVAPGDLVVAMQMEEVPLLAYYLPDGLRFATATGPVADPRVADWRDALARIEAATPANGLEPSLAAAPVGSKIVLVCAPPWTGPKEIPWFTLMERRCAEWGAALTADARFAPAPVAARGSSAGPSAGDPAQVDGRQVLAFTRTAP